MEIIKAIFDAMRDPQMRHAALVHVPVALSMLGLVPVLVSVIFSGRRAAPRWVACAAYALLLLTALVTVQSGQAAHDELGLLPDEVYQTVEEHQQMAEKIWIFALVTGVLMVSGALPGQSLQKVSDRLPGDRLSKVSNWLGGDRPRKVSAWLAALAGLATAGWVGVTAHHGGTLVYEWGVGTPKPLTVLEAAQRRAEEKNGEVDEDERPEGEQQSLKPEEDRRIVFFRQRVRPILESNCMRCHNPVGMKKAGQLDQTTIAGLLKGGRSGPAIVPGQPEDSLLIEAVRWESEDLEMPPPGEGERLTEDEIAALEQWVRDGAAWAPFEFTPPPPQGG